MAYKDYVEKTGRQPERRTVHNGAAIGNWLCNTIRPRKNKLPAEIVKKLDELGVVWETKRRRSPSVRASDTGKPEAQKVETPVDTWFRYFELCRECMWMRSGKMINTDKYSGKDVGFWFHTQIGAYAAGVFSQFKRLLVHSLILLDESQGVPLRTWYWKYSHCLELVLSKGILPSEDKDRVLPFDGATWFSLQIEFLREDLLLTSQQKAMELLLAGCGKTFLRPLPKRQLRCLE